MTASPGAALARLRKTAPVTCPHCGQVKVLRVRAIYCSPKCRKSAAYERRKQTKEEGKRRSIH